MTERQRIVGGDVHIVEIYTVYIASLKYLVHTSTMPVQCLTVGEDWNKDVFG